MEFYERNPSSHDSSVTAEEGIPPCPQRVMIAKTTYAARRTQHATDTAPPPKPMLKYISPSPPFDNTPQNTQDDAGGLLSPATLPSPSPSEEGTPSIDEEAMLEALHQVETNRHQQAEC